MQEFLSVGFASPQHVTEVRVYVVENTPFVTRVVLTDTDGLEHVVWELSLIHI